MNDFLYEDVGTFEDVEEKVTDLQQKIDRDTEEAIAYLNSLSADEQAEPYVDPMDVTSEAHFSRNAKLIYTDPITSPEAIPEEEEGGSFTDRVLRLAKIATQEFGEAVVGAATLGEQQGVFSEAIGGRTEPENFVEEVTGVIGQVGGQAATIKGAVAAGATAGGAAGSIVPLVGTTAGAIIGAGTGLAVGLGATLYNAVKLESDGVRKAVLQRGGSPEAADKAATAASVNIAVTEGLSLIPLTAVFGKFGKVFKVSDLLPDRVKAKMSNKVFDKEVANALSKLGVRSKKARAAVTGFVLGGAAEGGTETLQGGINDAIIALAAGEDVDRAVIEALDPKRRLHEFLVAGTGAGIVIGAGAAYGARGEADVAEGETPLQIGYSEILGLPAPEPKGLPAPPQKALPTLPGELLPAPDPKRLSRTYEGTGVGAIARGLRPVLDDVDLAPYREQLRSTGAILKSDMSGEINVIQPETLDDIARNSSLVPSAEKAIADIYTLRDSAAQESVLSFILDPELRASERFTIPTMLLSNPEEFVAYINGKYSTIQADLTGLETAKNQVVEGTVPELVQIQRVADPSPEQTNADVEQATREVQGALTNVAPSAGISAVQQKTFEVQQALVSLEKDGKVGDTVVIPVAPNPLTGDPGVKDVPALVASIEQDYSNLLRIASYDTLLGRLTVQVADPNDKSFERETFKHIEEQEYTPELIAKEINSLLTHEQDAVVRFPIRNPDEMDAVQMYANNSGLYSRAVDNGDAVLVANIPSAEDSVASSRILKIIERRHARIEQERQRIEDVSYTNPPSSPDTSAVVVPVDRPHEATFKEDVPFYSMTQEQRQKELNKQANTRMGLTGPKERPGADNTTSSDTGTVDLTEASVPNDPVIGIKPDTLVTEQLLEEIDKNTDPDRFEGFPSTEAGILPGLNENTSRKDSAFNTHLPEVLAEMVHLAKVLGGILRPGTLKVARGSKAGNKLAEYDKVTRILRTKDASDIVSASHEIGHLHKHFVMGNKKHLEAITDNVRKDLTRLGKSLYPDMGSIPGTTFANEGWGEMMRLYLTRAPESIQAEVPYAFEWFENTLKNTPEVYKQAQRTREFAIGYQNQSPAQRTRNAMAGSEAMSIKWRRLKNKLGHRPQFYTGEFYRAMVEEGAPLKQMETDLDDYYKSIGKPLDKLNIFQRVFSRFDALRGTVGERVGHVVMHGMIDPAGNAIGKESGGYSLREALASVKDQLLDFKIYIWAKRAQAVYGAKRADESFTFKHPGISEADAISVVTEIEAREDGHKFVKSHEKLLAFLDGVSNYAKQMSPGIMGPVVDAIRAGDPGFYIPLQREFTELEGMYSKIREESPALSSEAGIFEALKAKGSTRRIKDPIENIIKYTQRMVTAAHNQSILETMYSIRNLPGMSKYITEVDATQLEGVSIPMQKALNAIYNVRGRDKAGNPKQVSPDTVKAFKDLMASEEIDLAESYISVMHAPIKSPKGEWIYLPIHINNSIQWVEIDGGIFDALMNSHDLYRTSTAARWMLHVPNRLFRAGTTTANVSFSLGTNVLRDLRSFMVQTQSAARTPTLLYTWFPMVWNTFMYAASKGNRTGILNKEVNKVMLDYASRTGIFKSNRLEQDARGMRRAERMLRDKHGFSRIFDMDTYASLFDYYTDILSSTETATRVAEMKLVAEEMGIDTSKPFTVTQAQSMELMRAAKRVTTDFAAAGMYSRHINRIIPFYNASIQGPRTLARAGKADLAKVSRRMMYGSALAAWLWYENKDEDWWHDLTPMEKYLYSWFPIEIDGRKEMLRIPRAFEIDGLSMSLVESMLDAAYKEDPKAMQEWFGAAFRASVPHTSIPSLGLNLPYPIPLPVIMDEILDQVVGPGGFDHFHQRPIVSEGMARGTKSEEQYYAYTTDTAKFIGKVAGVSPIRFEHMIRGITGSVGMSAIKGAESAYDTMEYLFSRDRSVKEVAMDKELKQRLPILGVFFNATGDVSRAPRVIDELYTLKDEMFKDRDTETPTGKHIRLMLDDGLNAISALNKVARITKNVDDRRLILKKRRDIAVDLREKIENQVVRRGLFKAARKRAEVQLKQMERLEAMLKNE